MQVEPAQPRRRRQQTVRNMVWSLVPLLALIVIFVVIFQPGKQPTNTVNPQPDFSYATHQMRAPVPAPHGLSGKWRPTSSDLSQPDRQGRVKLEVGYITPQNQFAELVESNRPVADLVRNTVPGSTRQGSVTVGGTDWARYKTSRGEIALAAPHGRVSVVVTGSAKLTELQTLAASLR